MKRCGKKLIFVSCRKSSRSIGQISCSRRSVLRWVCRGFRLGRNQSRIWWFARPWDLVALTFLEKLHSRESLSSLMYVALISFKCSISLIWMNLDPKIFSKIFNWNRSRYKKINLKKFMQNHKAGQLYLDNGIFLSSNIRGDSEFMETNLRSFGSRVEKVDFGQPDASNFINAWCENKTHGHVTDVVSAGKINF